MTARLRCLVPYCRRTRGPHKGELPIDEWEEWICGPHWRLVSQATKAEKNEAFRLFRKAARILDPAHREKVLGRLGFRAARAWEKCKAEAIERAMGV